MKLRTIILFLLFISANFYAQRLYKISVQLEGKEETLSFIVRNGVDYVSLDELAALFFANKYYNSEAGKLEIKFSEYTLKFTAKNQFVVLTRRKDAYQKIFQIPISTIQLKESIFIPLIYCVDYFSLGYGKKLVYDNRTKNLKVTEESFTEEKFFVLIQNEKKPAVGIDEPIRETSSKKYDISGIEVEEKSNGTLIRLKSSRKLNTPRHSISNGILFLFLPNVTVAPDIAEKSKPGGLVKQIKKINVSAKNIQLEFALAEGYSTAEVFQDSESNDIVITIHNRLFTNQNQLTDAAKSKWLFDCVVIDAGHGGKDPGAIGVSGVKEKDVNLSIALKLGKLIEKNLPEIRVVYTRKKDEFVELYKRGKTANENGGKLFISIHCNSTEQKDISYRGFEVYLLRPGRTKEAIRIAEFENSVIKYEENPERYQTLTDENFILVSMAHSQYMRYSEQFADLLNQEWIGGVEIPSLGVKQAGFFVLVGASMPGVLIETGFLSNRKDESRLSSVEGQAEIAHAIFEAVKRYKEKYNQELGY